MEPFPGRLNSGEPKEGDLAQPYLPPEGSRLETALKGSNLEYFLPGLPELEQQVILIRNGLGGHEKETLDRTAQLLDFSREWIRQVENRALQRLTDLVEERQRTNT